ncbi:MAG: NAD(P)/FAD-dependent oxidoreductase [Ruminococcaceae bacterium]|nr:NAD(P)/FAD-dependent oxidoreductase [Oscillospiraceae bacterium]
MASANVIVVGGGAAGMFAAITAAKSGCRVRLLEKNDKLGKKLGITGKGRCNVTNDCTAEEVLRQIPRNPKFLFSAMRSFPPEKIMEFFRSNGCPLKTERGQRVFPESDQAQSVIQTLKTAMRRAGVKVEQAEVTDLLIRDGVCCGVITGTKEKKADAVILATGGCSYPLTGSTGDGYRMAASVGHTIIEPRGSLVPLEEDGKWCAMAQGLSLRNVQLRLLGPKSKLVYSDFGEMLFTHFGLSGPLVLSASAHMKQGERYRALIDLKPALDEAALDARMLRDFEKYKNRNFENALCDLYPAKLIPLMITRSGIPPAQKVNSITKAQRRKLCELTKNLEIYIKGTRPVEEAIITAGGIRTAEIDPATMESKCAPGLYLAGEIIDCDAYTGGFNLQIAWATGFAAGRGAAKKLGKEKPL